jgi:hypothetical protein
LPNSILTNTASTGIWTFTDPNPPLPSAYYRTVQAYFTLLWGGNLNPTYNGNAHTVTASSSPPGMAVSLTYNGSSAAPINAGSYTVVGTIADGNFTGSMTNTLTIAKAAATIAFIDFIWDDNSDLETAIVETDPLGLSVNITSMPDPKNQQYLDVTATITDPNYTGVATAVILIPPANQ